jgi:hypothetical protein
VPTQQAVAAISGGALALDVHLATIRKHRVHPTTCIVDPGSAVEIQRYGRDVQTIMQRTSRIGCHEPLIVRIAPTDRSTPLVQCAPLATDVHLRTAQRIARPALVHPRFNDRAPAIY